MKVLKFLDVYLWDGGERHNYAHSFNAETTSKRDLELTFKHCQVYEKTIVLFDNVTDFDQNKNEIKRQAVLAKLTPEERALLGV
jgi:hypothetical protein